ncbi:MAG: hypothetical protein ACE5EY_00040 [Anaerolineae bacterium]
MKEKSAIGKWNIGVGLWVMAAFMIYGFVLIYLRDFAPDKAAWIASYNDGAHSLFGLTLLPGNRWHAFYPGSDDFTGNGRRQNETIFRITK